MGVVCRARPQPDNTVTLLVRLPINLMNESYLALYRLGFNLFGAYYARKELLEGS